MKHVKFKFLVPLLLVTLFQAGGAWADVMRRGDDFGSFIRLRNRTVDTHTHISVFQPPPPSASKFYILQFNGPVEETWKIQLSSIGVRFLDYIPDNAFIVKVPASSFSAVQSDPNVKWLGDYLPGDKLYKRPPDRNLPAGRPTNRFVVKVFDDEDMTSAINSIESLGGQVHVVSDKDGLNGKLLNVTIDEALSKDITSIPAVETVEARPVPVLHNDVAVTPGVMNVTPVWNLASPLTGKGQVVGILDTGIDTGNTAAIHQAFSGNAGNGQPKIKYAFTYGRPGTSGNIYTTGLWSDPDGHGTHTSGSLAGKAVTGYNVKGVAYDAQIVIQSALDSKGGLGGVFDLNSRCFPDAYGQGVRVHSNSWGDSYSNGQYNSDCVSADTFAWNHKDFLALFSAGNDGIDRNSDGIVDLGSISAPSTAKNVLAVGASENYRPSFSYSYGGSWASDYPVNPLYSDLMANNANGMVAFSSRGPTDDGRIKPDVVAPGSWVLSDKSSLSSSYWSVYNTYFAYDGGTSMSCPLTAGSAAIVRQYYTDIRGITNPSAALIKATIINGATNMYPGQYPTPQNDVTAWPDDNQGFGRVNLARSIAPDAPSAIDYADNSTGLTTGGSNSYTYTVGDASVPVRVTLVWTDYPGSGGSGAQLVNDLDLEVAAPSGNIYHGNIPGNNPGEDKANFDGTNNVESIEIPVSDLTAGSLTVNVNAYNVPQGPQPYALVIRYGKGAGTLSASMASFGKAGGSGSFNVTATGPWTAVSNNDTWLFITSGSGGTGNGTVSYSVDPYTGKGIRTGSITVAGSTFTVTQSGVQTLTVSANPVGGGTISLPSGQYDYGSTISLQAVPNTGYSFSGWSGDATGSANPLSVTMTSDKTVVANFAKQGLSLGYTQNGTSITATAAMNYNGSPVSGKTVTFYNKLGSGSYSSKGTATTNSSGVAKKTFTASIGSNTMYAAFAASGGIPAMSSGSIGYLVKKVTLISPATGAIVPGPQPLLSWSLYSADTTKYHVQVSTSSTFATKYLKLNADTADASTSLSAPTLTKGTTYYWRVQAYIPTGMSVYSDSRKLVYKEATSLTLVSVTKTLSTVTVKAKLVDSSSNALASKTLTFYDKTGTAAYVSKGTATTASSTGIATKSWTWKPGSHLTKATFAGNSQYSPSTSGETSY